jgi:hypothetical protein
MFEKKKTRSSNWIQLKTLPPVAFALTTFTSTKSPRFENSVIPNVCVSIKSGRQTFHEVKTKIGSEKLTLTKTTVVAHSNN